MARSRPSDGRETLGRETVSKASSRAGFAAQRPALSKSAGLAKSLFHLVDRRDSFSPKHEEKERQSRLAPSASAGEKAGWDECSHSEQTGFSPATGDSIACRSAFNQRLRISGSMLAPLRLCVFAWLEGWVGSVSSVPLWFFDRGRVDGLAVLGFLAVQPCPTTRRNASSAR